MIILWTSSTLTSSLRDVKILIGYGGMGGGGELVNDTHSFHYLFINLFIFIWDAA
jgi:hypothetical protein